METWRARGRAEDGFLAGDPDPQRTLNGIRSTSSTSAARIETQRAEVFELLGVAVRDSGDRPICPAVSDGQVHAADFVDHQVRARDRIAVRIMRRMAEGRVHPRLEILREVMLKPLGLGMDLRATACRATRRGRAPAAR